MDVFNTYFMDIVKNHYADFNGRARRKEFWMFYAMSMAVIIAISIVFGILASVLDMPILMTLGSLVSLALFIPILGAMARRLHDTGKSGWFMLVSFIPLIGGIWLLYLLILEGTMGDNEYGADPKAGER